MPGGLLLGHHRFAILIVVRMMHRGDNAVAAVHLARITRLPDQMAASMSMMAAMGNHMMHRSIMRPMRQSPGRSEVSSHRRRLRGLGILQVREILVLVLMYLQGGEELRVVIPDSKSKMRSVVVAHDAIVVAAVFGGRG